MSIKNFHVPLSEELFGMLQAEAARRGRPRTQLAREILEQQLRLLQADAVDQQIEQYALEMAHTSHDAYREDGASQLWELLKDDEW